ncbi:MAG: signal peptidase I [Acidimicrobiales bacterium]
MTEPSQPPPAPTDTAVEDAFHTEDAFHAEDVSAVEATDTPDADADARDNGAGAPGGDVDQEHDQPRSLARNLVEWVAILAGALVVSLLVTRFLVQAFFIPSESMLPTLAVQDRILVNKLSYQIGEIDRGDLVVFERPASEGSEIRDLVKRVVALEGETIEARDGRLFIDGAPLSEPYLEPSQQTFNLERQTIPPGHVFVMGDNRDDSRDSRFFGSLPEDRIIGQAFVKVWPIGDFRLL